MMDYFAAPPTQTRNLNLFFVVEVPIFSLFELLLLGGQVKAVRMGRGKFLSMARSRFGNKLKF